MQCAVSVHTNPEESPDDANFLSAGEMVYGSADRPVSEERVLCFLNVISPGFIN